ncbi:NUDIX hydrolase [Streptomyces finlayi]|nr:NUDIX hydrolase [Streptomyces finlayi]
MGNNVADRQSTPLHSVSVAGAVIRDDGRALAIQRADNGAWEPPGGVLELHESPEEGVRREVREETGLDVTVGPLSGVYKNVGRGIVSLVFRCRAGQGDPHPTDEARTVAWLTRKEVAELMTEAYAVRVLDAYGPGPTPVRTHDGTRITPARP